MSAQDGAIGVARAAVLAVVTEGATPVVEVHQRTGIGQGTVQAQLSHLVRDGLLTRERAASRNRLRPHRYSSIAEGETR